MILGIWLLAASFGIIGYQALCFYFYGNWPPVAVDFIWQKLFGPWPTAGGWIGQLLAWCGEAPLFAVGVIIAYITFLWADTLRRREAARLALPYF